MTPVPPEPGDAARVRFFPPGIPLATIALGVALQYTWPLSIAFGLPSSLRHAAGALIVAGAIVVLGAWPVILFRRGGQSANPWKPTSHIERRGPFRITRNPMYLQMVLVCIGVALYAANGWILLLTPLAVWALQRLAIEPEEAYLERKFGERYLAYKREVRRWL